MKRKTINTYGKPYIHVGFRDDGHPRFVRKPQKQLEKELASMGKAPIYGLDGVTMVGTTDFQSKHLRKVAAEMDMKKNATGNTDDLPTIRGQKLWSGRHVEVRTWGQFDPAFEFEVRIRQTRAPADKRIRFGPVEVGLDELMRKQGYYLEAHFTDKETNPACNRKIRIYLTDGVDRYKVLSTDFYELQAVGKEHGRYDMSSMIADGTNLLRTHSSALYPKPTIQTVTKEVQAPERDPFDVLAKRYPRPKKKGLTLDTIVGNRTLGERLQDWVE